MSAVVTTQAAGHLSQLSMPVPQPASEGAALLALIERAARDPSVDLDKMERLLAMRDAMERRAEERAFAQAMSAAQAEMRSVSTDASNLQTRSRYASYLALDKELRPIYTKHGLALSFDTADCERPDTVRIVCDVMCGGYSRRYHIDMPADGKGAKGNDVMTKTHATGSAVTYGRRYLLMMIFNISVGTWDSDDDGNAAGGHVERISKKQEETLQAAIAEAGVPLPTFLAFYKLARVADLPAHDYDRAIRKLEVTGAAR